MTSALYLSFPKGYVKDEDLSTAIQHRFNSSLSTAESIEFFIRRFWSQIMANENSKIDRLIVQMLKAEIIHYALYWSGSDKAVSYFYHFFDLLKPNLNLVIDRTKCWTFSYKMTNLQYAMHRDDPKTAALLLAHGANPSLKGSVKPSHAAKMLAENMTKFDALVADLNSLPRDEFLKKYDIEDKRSPKAKDIDGFEFNKLLPEIKEIILNMVIDRQFEWLRLVCKEWRDLTMKFLRAKVPRVPKKMIGTIATSPTEQPYDNNGKNITITVTNTLVVLETDEVSLKIFQDQLDLQPTQTSLERILPEFNDIPSFAGDEFKEFILDYYNTGCKYVACSSSVSTWGDCSESKDQIFICKAASFGVLIMKCTLIEGLPDREFF